MNTFEPRLSIERYQAIAHYYATLSLLGHEVPILASEAAGGG